MPSKRAQKKASQGTDINQSVKELCEQITQAHSNKRGRIHIPKETIESLSEALHSVKANHELKSALVLEIYAVLEKNNTNICDQLDTETFCIILDLVLKAEYCRESERILALFAGTIHKGLRDLVSFHRGSFDDRLIKIAKTLELGELISYFTDTTKATGTRRWVSTC
ncbi:hypothetical protein ACMFMG_006891 [Clarireedia jacksonii]